MSDYRAERDEIARTLRGTEERFRIAQAAGGIGWFEWALATNTWEWTPHVAVLFGFNPETPRPSFANWQPAIFIDDVPKLRSAVEQAGEAGPYYVEFRVTHPDGSLHWIAGKGEVTKDETGRPQRVAGVYFDISERKALEARLLALNEGLEARVADRARRLAATAAQLEETELRFRHLIDGVTDYAIFMLDLTGNIISWNPGAERIKGYTSEEISASTSPASTPKTIASKGSRNSRSLRHNGQENTRPKVGASAKMAAPSWRMSSSTLFVINSLEGCWASRRSRATSLKKRRSKISFVKLRRWRQLDN